MKDILKITKSAHLKLVELTKKYNSKNILYSVKGGGCNGFDYRSKMHKDSYRYSFKPINYKPSSEMKKIVKDDYCIYICEFGEKHLVNSIIDWESTFMDEKFIFDNPNAEFCYKCKNSFISKIK